MTNQNDLNNMIDTPSYCTLRRLGLSQLSAQCYETLYEQPYLDAQKLADHLQKPYRSIYRNMGDLERKGFIRKLYTAIHPNRYEAILLVDALQNFARWQQKQVEDLLKSQQIRYYERELQVLKNPPARLRRLGRHI